MNKLEGLSKVIEKHKKQKAQLEQQEKSILQQTKSAGQPKRKVIKIKPKGEEKIQKDTPHGGKPIEPSMQSIDFQEENHRPPRKQKRFEETQKRFTNYLKNDYLNTIHDLKKRGEIESMSSLLNNAVHEYLARYFSTDLYRD